MTSEANGYFASALEVARSGDLVQVIECPEKGLAVDLTRAFYWAWLGSHYNEREQCAAAKHASEMALALDDKLAVDGHMKAGQCRSLFLVAIRQCIVRS